MSKDGEEKKNRYVYDVVREKEKVKKGLDRPTPSPIICMGITEGKSSCAIDRLAFVWSAGVVLKKDPMYVCTNTNNKVRRWRIWEGV